LAVIGFTHNPMAHNMIIAVRRGIAPLARSAKESTPVNTGDTQSVTHGAELYPEVGGRKARFKIQNPEFKIQNCLSFIVHSFRKQSKTNNRKYTSININNPVEKRPNNE